VAPPPRPSDQQVDCARGLPGEVLAVVGKPVGLLIDLLDVTACEELFPWVNACRTEPVGAIPFQLLTLLESVDDLHRREAPVGGTQVMQPVASVGRLAEPCLSPDPGSLEGEAVPGDLGEVADRVARLGEVPVDEPHDAIVAPDGVPRTEVTVADDLIGGWLAGRAAAGQMGSSDGDEPRHGSVVAGKQSRDLDQPPESAEHRRPRSSADRSRDVGEDLTSRVVDAERTVRLREADPLEVTQKRVDRQGPRPRRATHGLSEADDVTDRAARQPFFGAAVRAVWVLRLSLDHRLPCLLAPLAGSHLDSPSHDGSGPGRPRRSRPQRPSTSAFIAFIPSTMGWHPRLPQRRQPLWLRVLADQLDAARGAIAPPDLAPIPVDLKEVVMHLAGDQLEGQPWRLDVETGRPWPDDPEGLVAEEQPDHWEENDQWVELTSLGSRQAWEDMAEFTERLEHAELADRLERAIEGPVAFHSFKDVLAAHDAALLRAWFRFAEERQRGRAREYLVLRGYLAVPRPREADRQPDPSVEVGAKDPSSGPQGSAEAGPVGGGLVVLVDVTSRCSARRWGMLSCGGVARPNALCGEQLPGRTTRLGPRPTPAASRPRSRGRPPRPRPRPGPPAVPPRPGPAR
jgi:hypothetical protein